LWYIYPQIHNLHNTYNLNNIKFCTFIPKFRSYPGANLKTRLSFIIQQANHHRHQQQQQQLLFQASPSPASSSRTYSAATTFDASIMWVNGSANRFGGFAKKMGEILFQTKQH
jgi:hypothetical protein